MTLYIGVDLGGTKIAVAVFDAAAGKLITRNIIPTHAHEGPDAVLKRMASAIEDVCRDARVTPRETGGVGVGAPAVVDMAGGRTLLVPNMVGWYGKPIAAILRDYLGCPVWVINDARAFALAEATWGAGRGVRNVVGITIGTGIGGGIVLDGKLFLGIDGATAEIGHHTVDPHGPPCNCGNRGCMESLASGPAITTLGVKAVIQGSDTLIGKLVDFDLNKITPIVIMRAAEQGDAVAQEILQRTGGYAGIGIANVVSILGPDRVIIGGGVSKLGDWLLNPVRAMLHQRCKAIPLDRVEILVAALGDDAGVIGTAMWAEHQSNQ